MKNNTKRQFVPTELIIKKIVKTPKQFDKCFKASNFSETSLLDKTEVKPLFTNYLTLVKKKPKEGEAITDGNIIEFLNEFEKFLHQKTKELIETENRDLQKFWPENINNDKIDEWSTELKTELEQKVNEKKEEQIQQKIKEVTAKITEEITAEITAEIEEILPQIRISEAKKIGIREVKDNIKPILFPLTVSSPSGRLDKIKQAYNRLNISRDIDKLEKLHKMVDQTGEINEKIIKKMNSLPKQLKHTLNENIATAKENMVNTKMKIYKRKNPLSAAIEQDEIIKQLKPIQEELEFSPTINDKIETMINALPDTLKLKLQKNMTTRRKCLDKVNTLIYERKEEIRSEKNSEFNTKKEKISAQIDEDEKDITQQEVTKLIEIKEEQRDAQNFQGYSIDDPRVFIKGLMKVIEAKKTPETPYVRSASRFSLKSLTSSVTNRITSAKNRLKSISKGTGRLKTRPSSNPVRPK